MIKRFRARNITGEATRNDEHGEASAATLAREADEQPGHSASGA